MACASPASAWSAPSRFLHREQAVEQGPIAVERQTQLLRVGVAIAFQVVLQRAALFSESLRQPLHHFADELVGAFHGRPRLVDEAGLNVAPALSELLRVAGVEE